MRFDDAVRGMLFVDYAMYAWEREAGDGAIDESYKCRYLRPLDGSSFTFFFFFSEP